MTLDRKFTWPNDGKSHYGGAPNPSYEPEACGLTQIAELTDPNACYSFDAILFWKDNATGAIYAAHDSGCSCPTPFESYTSLADLTLIQSEGDARVFIDQHQSEYGGGTWPLRDVQLALAAVELVLQRPALPEAA